MIIISIIISLILIFIIFVLIFFQSKKSKQISTIHSSTIHSSTIHSSTSQEHVRGASDTDGSAHRGGRALGSESLYEQAMKFVKSISLRKDNRRVNEKSKKNKDTPDTKIVVEINENGSKIQSITETFIDNPYRRCYYKKYFATYDYSQYEFPSHCDNITKQSGEMYIYDEIGGRIDSVTGGMLTGFDDNTTSCNGNTDCIYYEVFDSKTGNIVDIQNSKGDKFIDKIAEGLWNGRINIDEQIQTFNKSYKLLVFDHVKYNKKTGELFFMDSKGISRPIVPGLGARDGNIKTKWTDKTGLTEFSKEDNEYPIGLMIMYILMYYKVNNLPKPDIKLNIKISKRFGEDWHEWKNKMVDEEVEEEYFHQFYFYEK